MADPGTAERVYVVTDIEVDGFVPGANSMLSLASVAVTASGEQVGEFEAVLAGLPGAQPDPQVWAWFGTQPPEVVAAATTATGETAGAAARLVDPASDAAIADALRAVLQDPVEADRLRRAAVAHAAGFTWDRTADLLVASWRRAVA